MRYTLWVRDEDGNDKEVTQAHALYFAPGGLFTYEISGEQIDAMAQALGAIVFAGDEEE